MATFPKVQAGLKKLWKGEPVTYGGWEKVTQEEVDRLLNQLPDKYDFKPVSVQILISIFC